jgi:hypothetical protein
MCDTCDAPSSLAATSNRSGTTPALTAAHSEARSMGTTAAGPSREAKRDSRASDGGAPSHPMPGQIRAATYPAMAGELWVRTVARVAAAAAGACTAQPGRQHNANASSAAPPLRACASSCTGPMSCS